jgi:hypothetical protein
MTIEGLILSAFVGLVFLLWVWSPFTEQTVEHLGQQDVVSRQQERLTIYYERVLRNLHDIDEDYATGKLSQHDYQIERERWVNRGVQALRALEQLDAEHLVAPSMADKAEIDEAISQTIEEAIDQQETPA